jgi:hypothetical protein
LHDECVCACVCDHCLVASTTIATSQKNTNAGGDRCTPRKN